MALPGHGRRSPSVPYGMKSRNVLLALVAATVLVLVLIASAGNFFGRSRMFVSSLVEPQGETVTKKVRVGLAGEAPIEVARAAGGGTAGPAAPEQAQEAGTPPGESLRGHQLARTGAVALLVPDVEKSLAAVERFGALEGGAILSLDDERPEAAGAAHTADIKVAVPSDHFESSLNRLAQLGGLRSRTENAEDVTDQVVDDAARLRNLRRTEADLRAIMDRSGKISDVVDAENQLSSTRDEIERLGAEAASLHEQVAYATIDVSLASEGVVPSVEPNAPGQLHDAWIAAFKHARDFSLGFASFVFLVLAFAPYWLVMVLGFAAFTWYRRRRAQHAAIV